VFVEELEDVPDDATVIFSAHGVSKAVRAEAERRGLTVFDATCPLVTKVHMEVVRHVKAGCECILIGHAGHPEVEGTMGQIEKQQGTMHLVETAEDVAKLKVNNENKLAFVTQTTLSMDDTGVVIDALRERFPNIVGPKKDDICYATQNRQDAIKHLVKNCEAVLVVGSHNSSNSNRLREIAEQQGIPSWLIDGPEDIQASWLEDKKVVGLTAGASAPELLVQSVIKRLQELGADIINEDEGTPEKVTFTLPKSLR